MIGNKLLLDTNIIVEIFNGNKLLAYKVHEARQVYVPAIVLGELYVGIYRVKSQSKHLEKLHNFLNICTIMSADSDTANIYGRISSELYKKGKPIPSNDIWIAAITIQNNMTLITYDKHFKEINNLKTKSW